MTPLRVLIGCETSGAKRAPARPAPLPPRPEPTRLPGLDPVTGEPLF